jgi:hypothetical protein
MENMEIKDVKTRTALPVVITAVVFIIVWFLITFLINGKERGMERNLGTNPMIPGESAHSTKVVR